jgi:hypothetical protein
MNNSPVVFPQLLVWRVVFVACLCVHSAVGHGPSRASPGCRCVPR